MKILYKESAKKRISKLIKDINKSVSQLGELKIRKILENYFGLSREDSIEFIKLINKLDYIEAGYDTVPEDWYFTEVGLVYKQGMDGKKRRSETVGHLSQQIFREREEVRNRIIKFRKLTDSLKQISIKRWPKEYRSYIMYDKSINADIDEYYPSNIANKIVASRWGISQDGVKKIIKKETNNN